MRAIVILASKEFCDGIRNRWFLGATGALMVFALGLTFVGSAPLGSVGVDRVAVTTVSLTSLAVFLLPLMALLLSYDALVGEVERGTMALLLTYPVARWQVVAGKFIGQTFGLGAATITGFGVAAVFLAVLSPGSANWHGYVLLVASSVWLGAVFVAIGLVISGLPQQRGAAAALAFIVWLVFVVMYDMALLGGLVADQAAIIGPALFNFLLLLNPADAFRMLNLAGVEDIRVAAGLLGAEMAGGLALSGALVSLLVWTLLPLGLAVGIFHRKSL
ncbi:ABC transporter permease subunit [uncultured Thalassospira sp.]|jgi:Cu-processing system permease protein|uniref:ABC transporter permease n=1 Tax=uncultured Thalassospira sp. TaxID=404382 RepID=UPI0030DC7873|tara:strand:+ start:6545 stop:7369 length:825 start_codon:yes stop_codon:yes gene_type:complete